MITFRSAKRFSDGGGFRGDFKARGNFHHKAIFDVGAPKSRLVGKRAWHAMSLHFRKCAYFPEAGYWYRFSILERVSFGSTSECVSSSQNNLYDNLMRTDIHNIYQANTTRLENHVPPIRSSNLFRTDQLHRATAPAKPRNKIPRCLSISTSTQTKPVKNKSMCVALLRGSNGRPKSANQHLSHHAVVSAASEACKRLLRQQKQKCPTFTWLRIECATP